MDEFMDAVSDSDGDSMGLSAGSVSGRSSTDTWAEDVNMAVSESGISEVSGLVEPYDYLSGFYWREWNDLFGFTTTQTRATGQENWDFLQLFPRIPSELNGSNFTVAIYPLTQLVFIIPLYSDFPTSCFSSRFEQMSCWPSCCLTGISLAWNCLLLPFFPVSALV